MMKSQNSAIGRSHVVWLDVVRFVAMFTVVCCHSADPFNFYPGEPPANIDQIKFWGAAYGSFLRPCVPLFVMITGALLLPLKDDTSVFYKKRISRVFWPFLIWSVLYNLFPWITGQLGLSPEVILDFFPYSGEEVARQSLDVSLRYIAEIPLNFSIVDVHMWYIYLLIGLYLYLPVFSAWVEKASEKAKLWFLLAWGVSTLLPYYYQFVSPYVWGGCSWNSFNMLYYFAGFNGYLLLGHYLRNHDWSLNKILLVGIPMFLIGYVVTFFGFRYVTALPEYSEELLELFFTYCSLNVVIGPRFPIDEKGGCAIRKDQEFAGKPDDLWVRNLYGALFLYRSGCRSDACLACTGGFTDTCRRGCRICHFLVDRSFHLSIDGEECQVCSRVTLYCNKVKLFKSMCLCVRKDVWVIFEQHLLRWSSNAWGELKVKSEEKMLDFLVDTPLLSVLALA